MALGFWSDGRREVLDWQIAKSEDHQEWEVLVHRVWERGCRPEQGLQLVVRDGSGGLGEALALVYGSTVLEQRCIFHKLHNVATKCRSELKGKEKRDLRKQLMEQAAGIYQAETASEARTLLVQWGKQWREQRLNRSQRLGVILSKRSCFMRSPAWLSNGYAPRLC